MAKFKNIYIDGRNTVLEMSALYKRDFTVASAFRVHLVRYYYRGERYDVRVMSEHRFNELFVPDSMDRENLENADKLDELDEFKYLVRDGENETVGGWYMDECGIHRPCLWDVRYHRADVILCE